MEEVWGLPDEEEDLQKLKEIESKLEYLENKGYFEAERMKELDEKLVKYFTKRMKECQRKSKRKTDGE
jgi:IS5 family transposase